MSKVLSNIFWATASSWIQQAFTFITVLFVARMVSPSAFGVVAVALLFILLFQRVLLESVGYLVVREDSSSCDKTFLDSAYFLAVMCSLLLAGIIFLCSSFLANLFDMPELAPVLKVLSVIPAFDGLCMVQTSLFRRNMQFKFITLRTSLVNVLSGCSGIALAFANYDIWALVWQQVIGSLTGCLVIFFSSNWRPGKDIRLVVVKDQFIRSLPMMGNAIMFVLTNRIDIMMLGLYSSAMSTGIYTIAKRITRTITDLLVTGVNSVSLTVFSELKNNSVLLLDSYFKNLRYISIVLYPCFAGLIVTADIIVPVLLGEKWLLAVSSVQILCITGFLQVIVLFLTNLMIALNHTKKLFFINAIAFIFLFLALTVMVKYGAEGVALAFALQMLLIVFIQLCILYYFEINLFVVSYRAISLPLICSVIMGVSVYTLKSEIGKTNLLYCLFLMISSGLAIYSLLILLFMRKDIFALVSKFAARKGKDD